MREQLIILKDFKECVTGDQKTYLEEQQVETLDAAANMAEEYILTQDMFQRPQNLSPSISRRKETPLMVPRRNPQVAQDEQAQ